MIKSDTRMKSVLLALALTLGGGGAALAQKPDKPVNTGQQPNSREEVKAEARAAARNSANTNVPPGGEASTMTNHQPNMQPVPISERSRAEVRQQAMPEKPRFGDTGERSSIPTNPAGKTRAGTPE